LDLPAGAYTVTLSSVGAKVSRSILFKVYVRLPNGQFNQNGFSEFGQDMHNKNHLNQIIKYLYLTIRTKFGNQRQKVMLC